MSVALQRMLLNPCAHIAFAMGMAAPLCACSDALPPAGASRGGPTAAGTSASARAPVCEDGHAWQQALDALPAAALTQVEPKYVWDTCVGTGQVTGVKLALLPESVESVPWTGLLTCGATRVPFAKGNGAATGAWPTWTPDGWVDIGVERGPKTVVLTVSAESVPKNIRLFRRLAAFAHGARE